MIEWSEQHLMIRDAIRKFVEAEIKPRLQEFEHGDTPPYDVLRNIMRSFGIDEVAKQRFAHQIAKDKARAAGGRDCRGQTIGYRRPADAHHRGAL